MDKKGITLLELLVVMAILVVVITGALTFLSSLTKRSSQETARSRTSQTGLISDLILIRDIAMAGMGVPVEDVVTGWFVPIGAILPGTVNPNNTGQNGSDQLMIKGAVISSGANDYFKWGYNTNYITPGMNNIMVSALPDNPPHRYSNQDVQDLFTLSRAGYRHPFENGDRVVFLDAETKQLLGSKVYTIGGAGDTGFNVAPNTDFTIRDYGSLIFSLGGINVNNFNDYLTNRFTGYRLSAGTQPQCAPNTRSLLRVYGGARDPILDCVLDFQVQFGLIDATGNVTWLNLNDIPATPAAILKDQLKIVRIFIVKQVGKRVPKYFYPFSTIPNASIPLFSVNSNGNVVNARPDIGPHANTIINLTNDQRHYHWRLITLDIPLRELQ